MSFTINNIIDIYRIDRDNPQNWFGYTDVFASASSNLINLKSYQLQFTPDGLDVAKWLSSDILKNKLKISTDSLVTYIMESLVGFGLPVTNVTQELDNNNALILTIFFTTGTTITDAIQL